MTRKGDSIGFQDFLIDSVFHNDKNQVGDEPTSPKTTSPVNEVVHTPIVQKEDPLSTYTPVATSPIIPPHPTTEIPQTQSPSLSDTIPEATVNTESIPDWLKVPAAMPVAVAPIVVGNPEPISTEVIQQEEAIPVETVAEMQIEQIEHSSTNSLIPEKFDPIATHIEHPVANHTEESNVIPDWIKNTTLTKENETKAVESTTTITPPVTPQAVSTDEERLPDWLMSSLQTEKPDEIETPETKESE